MNDFKQPQMPQFNMDPKKLGRYIAIGVLVVILLVGFIMSWKTVDPGYEGFVNKPYNGGVDASTTYKEGTHFIAPWNEMITYTVLQQSKTYTSTVMDKNGTDITVEVAINFSIQKGNTPTLHLKIGENYIQIIDDKSQGAIKNVIGKYTYEEVYSTKRNVLEGEIRDILIEKFNKNYVNLEYV